MNARVVISFLTLIAINVWFLMRLFNMVTPESGATKPVASISEMFGNVLVKNASQSEWRPLRFNNQLRTGDLVFIGQQSKLVFTYIAEKAKVTLNENTLIQITEKPSVLSKMFRNFYKTNSIGEKQLNDGERAALRRNRIYVRMERAPAFEENQKEKQSENNSEPNVDNSKVAGISVERVAKLIRITEPHGDVKIIADQTSTQFKVKLEQPTQLTKIFGYLWRKNDSPRPVWSGVVEGNVFSKITIPSPGEYIFQAISEEDDYISPTIDITFTKANVSDFRTLFSKEFRPEKWNRRQVLVLR